MQIIYRRMAVLCVILIFGSWLYILLFGHVMHDFLSLLTMGEIISYGKYTCIFIGGIPLLFTMFSVLVMALFSKDCHSQLPASIESSVTIIVAITFITGIVANCIVPFLLLALSYSSCPQEKLHDYYVTDIELCNNMLNNRTWW